MRHVWSLLVGVVVAPLAWLAMCIGQVGSGKEFTTYSETGDFVAGHFVRPFLLLVVAGLVLGVLACLRISPAGPVLVGAGYLATYAGLLIWPHGSYDLFAYTFHIGALGDQGHGDLTAPLTTGTAPLVGAGLLVAVVSVKRWRRWPKVVGSHSIEARDAIGTDVAPEYPVVSRPLVDSPAPVSPAAPAPVIPQPSVPVDDTVGTVVWTRDPVESPTQRTPGTGADTGTFRSRGPWDTPPGENLGPQVRQPIDRYPRVARRT